ncbi:MAG: site-specific DNA-methyltransferase [Pseudomonadota bacterium]
MAHEDGSYEWLHSSDWRVSEVRLLSEIGKFGETRSHRNRAKDNLLIQGDALNALTSLTRLPEFAREYVGKVKLCYIDPPFNTQQSFLHYDDALEHSVWLTMIRDRLVQVRQLLSQEGSVWLHCDDSEQAYAKVVLDEVFGRENFVANIIWEKADSPRNSARQFSTDHDYILVYSKAPDWKPYRLPRDEKSNSIYRNPDDDPRGDWLPGDPYANKPYSKGLYTLIGPTGREFRPPPGRYWRISEPKLKELDADSRIWWGPNKDARPSIKKFVSEVADLVPRTLWSKADVGSNRTSKNEMRNLFPGLESFATPKPEALIKRILEIGSKEGDIVLDCFLGSGTTAAVAHKGKRAWVGIEMSIDTIDAYSLPRIRKVITGEDEGGVSDEFAWTGGGGMRHIKVEPSMFDEDDGTVYLADWATNGNLAEATAAQLGYDFCPELPFAGIKGRTRLAVIDGLVNEAVVRAITGSLGEGERVVLCGTAIDPDCRHLLKELRPGSTLRKIPSSILAMYR